MLVQITKDGPKNCSVLVKGIATADFVRTPLFGLSQLTPPSQGWKGLRLDSAMWTIQEKMGIILWWEDEESPESLILPMESRNFVRFDEGVPSPRADKWKKQVWLSGFRVGDPQGDKAFFFILDFDKQ